jgi:hypothetical protein
MPLQAEQEFHVSKCISCKHHIKAFKCEAFDDIPIQIFGEEIEHDVIYEGQKGEFIYEKKEDNGTE